MLSEFVGAAIANQCMKTCALVNGKELQGINLVVKADTAGKKIKKLTLADTSRNPWFELCSLSEPQMLRNLNIF